MAGENAFASETEPAVYTSLPRECLGTFNQQVNISRLELWTNI